MKDVLLIMAMFGLSLLILVIMIMGLRLSAFKNRAVSAEAHISQMRMALDEMEDRCNSLVKEIAQQADRKQGYADLARFLVFRGLNYPTPQMITDPLVVAGMLRKVTDEVRTYEALNGISKQKTPP